MSITQAQRVRLGVFLSAGILLLIVFAVIPLGFRLKNTTNSFFAYFSGESLSGLEQGATVKFSGVPIGKVEKISYLPNDLRKVRVDMKIQSDFPVKTDMIATTGAMGITGLKYVEISGGTDSADLLVPGTEITTKVSSFSTITGKAESIVEKVELLLNHLNELSNPDSLMRVYQIIKNIDELTGNVNKFMGKTSPDISEITVTVSTLIQRTDSIAQDIQKITGNLNLSIQGDRIGKTLSEIDSSAKALRDVAENVSFLVRQSREDFTVTMQNIRQASENADQLTKLLLENPSLLIRSETQKEREF